MSEVILTETAQDQTFEHVCQAVPLPSFLPHATTIFTLVEVFAQPSNRYQRQVISLPEGNPSMTDVAIVITDVQRPTRPAQLSPPPRTPTENKATHQGVFEC